MKKLRAIFKEIECNEGKYNVSLTLPNFNANYQETSFAGWKLGISVVTDTFNPFSMLRYLSKIKRKEETVLKILPSIIICMAILLCSCAMSAESAAEQSTAQEPVVAATNTCKFNKSQGVDGWYYYVHLNGKLTELLWDSADNKWKRPWTGTSEYPLITSNYMGPGHNGEDLNIRFVSPTSSYARLNWAYEPNYKSNNTGNGVKMFVLHNGAVIWEADVAAGQKEECHIVVNLEQNDTVDFRLDSKSNASFDTTTAWPSVQFLIGEYSNNTVTGNKNFFQKNNEGMIELEYNEQKRIYVAEDGVATINDAGVYPSKDFSMVKRYIVEESGRYRVTGEIKPIDNKSAGTIITVYKNDEIVRKQFYPAGKKGSFDLRMLAKVGDNIDIEASIGEYMGYNYTEWKLNVEKIPGVIPTNTTSVNMGESYNVISEEALADYIGSGNSEEVKIYTTIYGEKFNLVYNPVNKRYELTEKYIRRTNINASDERLGVSDLVYQHAVADTNWVSKTDVRTSNNPAPDSTTYIEIPVRKSGTLLIEGPLSVPSASVDGELVKIYLNDKVVWSNRIGGEVSTKFDEPYETKYFINDINAVLNVKAGDILKFSFNRWRKVYSNEKIDISKVKLKYIEKPEILEVNKWQLNNAIVIDTNTNTVYIKGRKTNYHIYVENGTTYISALAAKELFSGISSENEYIPLTTIAENNGKTVLLLEEGFIIIHDGIPGLFNWNELSEIKAKIQYTGGVLFD